MADAGGWQAYGPGLRDAVDPARLAMEPCPRTSLMIGGGGIDLAGAHLARLADGLAHLGVPGDWLPEAFRQALEAAPEGILRLRASPGEPLLLARAEPWRPPSQPWRLLPVPHPLGDVRGHPAAAHKGLLGGWNEASLGLARRLGAHDVLCGWPDGTISETAIAAVALPCGDHLRLPPPEGRVASLAEAHLLPAWARERGLSLRHGPVSLVEALARGLLCFNAVRGVWQAEVLPSARP